MGKRTDALFCGGLQSVSFTHLSSAPSPRRHSKERLRCWSPTRRDVQQVETKWTTAESFTHRNSTLTFNSLSIHSVKLMSDCYRDVSCAHFRFDLQTKFKTRFLRTVWLFPARLTASVSQFDFLLVTYPVSKISDLLFQSLDSKVYCVQHLRDHCNINTKYLPTYWYRVFSPWY